jgi:multidrug efflux system outer membrane protein
MRWHCCSVARRPISACRRARCEQVSIQVPAGLPSALLERRPDIAAAERAMAAANARVGVAQTAWFPRLNLTGALGYESSDLGNLFQWSSRSFLLGPLVGTMLTLPIFDGGARDAGLERARAAWEEDVANYRQTVLNAFREVEDNLAGLRILADQTRTQHEAVRSATRAAQLSQIQYREGSVSFLDVIDADRSVLLQQRVAVQLDAERARATVNLIRAMGGGWSLAAAE